jgi:hypothetical protein
MDLKEDEKKIKAQKEILRYMKLFGIGEDMIRHIISEDSDKPVVTMKPETPKEFKKIFKLLKPSMMDVFKKEDSCVSFEPIFPTMVDYETVQRLQHPVILDTPTTKYTPELRFRFFIDWKPKQEKCLDIWIEAPLNWFEKGISTGKYYLERIEDVFETQNARKYNYKAAPIYTERIIFDNLSTTKFWGGHTTHYSTTEHETETMKKLLSLEWLK